MKKTYTCNSDGKIDQETDSFENAMMALPNFLASSGLAVEDVPSWAYLNQFEVKMQLGHEKKRIVSDGIMIPYHDLHGQPLLVHGIPHMRVRLLNESWIEKNDGKYRSRANTGSQLYMPRALKSLLDSGQPLVITEGEKKAEALCKAGVPCVGLGGVAMGRVREDSEDKAAPRLLIPDLVGVVAEYLASASSDARVLVLFDSDGLPHATQSEAADKDVSFKGTSKFVANTSVHFEALTLAKALREEFLGTRVGPAWCPDAVDGSKQGVDDWLMAAGANTVLPEIMTLAGGGSFTTAARVAASQKKEQLADQGGYVALGQTADALAVWSKPGERVVLLTSSALSRQAEILRVTGAYYALTQWPKITKEGGVSLDILAAQVAIIHECQSKGFWIQSRERGGGVWLDQGELIINAASGLYQATGDGLSLLASEDRYSGEYLYPATGSYVIEPLALDTINANDIALKLGNHFKNWHWANRHDPLLMSGWILAQAYLGALDARPSITLCGESGAGKSVLEQHVSELLGGTAWRIDDGANSTAAGIRQKVGRDAVTLLIDESEPGSIDQQVAQQRSASLRRVLDMLRASYSVSDGSRGLATIKGSVDGRPVEFSVRTAAMLAAIGRPDFEQADRNRFIVLEVKKEGRAKTCPSMDGLSEMGNQLRTVMWSRWPVFQVLYAAILEHGPAETSGVDARLLKTWGVPLAALMTLCAEDAIEDSIEKMLDYLKAVAQEQGNAGGSDASETDSDKALMTLLGARMTIEKLSINGQTGFEAVTRLDRTVHEVFVLAYKPASTDNDNYAAKALKRVGMARIDTEDGSPMLFITDCAELRSLLKNTAFAQGQSIVNILARLPGATRIRQRVGGGQKTGISVAVLAE